MTVSAVTFEGASQEAGAETSWTVGFTVTQALLALDSLSITFPAGFDVSGAAAGPVFVPPGVTSVSFGGDYDEGTVSYQVEVAGQVLTVRLYDFDSPSDTLLAIGAHGTVTIDGIVNPGVGSYTGATAATNRETTPVAPASALVITGPATAPSVTTDEPSDVTATSATLNGTVSANGAETTVLFRYGLEPGLDGDTSTVDAEQSPLAADASGVAVSAEVTGRDNETLYYRVEATNSAGTSTGDVETVEPLPGITRRLTATVDGDRELVAAVDGTRTLMATVDG